MKKTQLRIFLLFIFFYHHTVYSQSDDKTISSSFIESLINVETDSTSKTSTLLTSEINLKTIINQLLENDIEISNLKSEIEELNLSQKSAASVFLPSLTIENGWQNSSLNSDNSNKTFLYGYLKWNLYNGGLDQLKQKKYNLEIDNIKNKLKNQITNKTYELLKNIFSINEIFLKLEKTNEKLSFLNQLLKKEQIKFNKGLITQSDYLKIELNLENTKLEIDQLTLELNQKKLDLNLSDSTLTDHDQFKKIFASYLQLNKDKLLKVFTSDLKQLKKEEILDLKVQDNITLNALNFERQINNLEILENQRSFFPQIDLESKYGRIGDESEVYENNQNYTILLKFSFPLFNGFNNYYKKQELQRQKLRIQNETDLTIQNNKNKLAKLVNNLEIISSKNRSLSKQLEISQKLNNIILSEYNKGLKTADELISFYESNQDIQLKEISLLTEYLDIRYHIFEIIGN